jgi:hypothetical protein
MLDQEVGMTAEVFGDLRSGRNGPGQLRSAVAVGHGAPQALRID